MASILLPRHLVSLSKFSIHFPAKAFLILFLVVGGTLPPLTTLHAEFHSLPIFPHEDKGKKEDVFKDIMEAYRAEDYQLAFVRNRSLLSQLPEGPLFEAATFLKADLAYKIARTGRVSYLPLALSSYEEAVAAYPKSENAIRAYWKIGEIYTEMGFFYESVGSYRRILTNHPKSRFASLAQRGIARAYKERGEPIQAAWEYRNTYRMDLPPSEKPITLVEYTDVLFLLGRYEKFYQLYRQGIDLYPQLIREQPESMFRYGESAFWTKRFPEARNIFTKFFNIHPKEPLRFVALVRVGDSWRHEANTENAEWIYSQVRSMKSNSLNWQIADLVLRIGQFPILGCCPPAPLEIFAPKRLPEVEIEIIKERALSSLTDEPISPTLHRILYESAILLREHTFLLPSIRIFDQLLASTPAPLIRKRLTAILRQTAAEVVQELSESDQHREVVALYFNYPNAFTERILYGKTGLSIGQSLTSVGLYSQAITFYKPITDNPKNPLRERALLDLSRTYLKYEETSKAIESIGRFISLYPKSRWIPEALTIQARAYTQQGNHKRAAQVYQSWLKRFPRHKDKYQVYLLLGDALTYQGKSKEVIPVYIRVFKVKKYRNPTLSIKIAEAYQDIGQHQKAIQYLKTTLTLDPSDSEKTWIQFRIAQNYESLGQQDTGRDLYQQLAEKVSDPLMRDLASQKQSFNR